MPCGKKSRQNHSSSRRRKWRRAKPSLLKNQENKCYYCLDPLKLKDATIEHKTPISRGGSPFALSNLAVCCHRCNSRKNNMTEREFRARMYYLWQ